MSTMILPSAWVKHRIGPDSITWTRADHTHDKPSLVIFKAGTAGAGTSKYQVKGVLGNDSDAYVNGTNTVNSIVELNLRFVDGQVDNDVKTLISEIADLITTVNFKNDAIDLQLPLDGNHV